MERKIYAERDGIRLFYAGDADRRLIYDMMFEHPEIWQSMFRSKDDFGWENMRDEEDHFFGSTPGDSKYLLIGHGDDIIGAISHTYHDGKTPCMELDTWLRSPLYTNRGLGSSAMQLLIDSLIKEHGTKIFIIRPWKKNIRAIKAYEKCGFRIDEGFDAADYYGKYLEGHGDGDYGQDETCSMVLRVV